jgi:hypothetical protein
MEERAAELGGVFEAGPPPMVGGCAPVSRSALSAALGSDATAMAKSGSTAAAESGSVADARRGTGAGDEVVLVESSAETQ